MKHYNYHQELYSVWSKAVERYQAGARGPENLIDPEDIAFLTSIGANSQDIYDFAEDYVVGGNPDFTAFALIQDVRRAYFLEVQKGMPSDSQIDPAKLPGKQEELAGIKWLPRIIQKAKAKLHGELDPDMMFCCGGDRNFFDTNKIAASEFLRVVWQNEDNEQAIVDWVAERSRA